MRRAVAEDVRSAAFPMLRNQAGVGGVGTYWVTLVECGLVEDDAGALTPRGTKLADAFLQPRATPDRARLVEVIDGKDIQFPTSVLTDWGTEANLGAASPRERQVLADALLEPDEHRRMAFAIRVTGAETSDGDTFRLLGEHLRTQRDPVSDQLTAVLAVATCFENLHRELLYHFQQVLASSEHHRPLALKSIHLSGGDAPLVHLGDTLREALTQHGARLPRTVAEAVHGFSRNVEPAIRARNDADLVRSLIRHHERVQAGKLDASRQPKRPWAELNGNEIRIDPRYAPESRPAKPGSTAFTHPYRIEQLTQMLREVGAWESST